MKTKSKTPKKLKEKTFTDGRDPDAPLAKNLMEAWGASSNKFGTTDEQKFLEKLSKMNKAEMYTLCTRHGLMPHDNRETMKERLLLEFRRHIAAIKTSSLKPIPAPTGSKDLEDAVKWLARAAAPNCV